VVTPKLIRVSRGTSERGSACLAFFASSIDFLTTSGRDEDEVEDEEEGDELEEEELEDDDDTARTGRGRDDDEAEEDERVDEERLTAGTTLAA